MRKIYLIIFLTTFTTFNVNALCLPDGKDNESKDEFIKAVTEAIVYVKEGYGILIADLPEKKGQSLTDQIADLLVNMKTANKKMDCAKEYIQRFKLSKNENVKSAAGGMTSAIETLIRLNILHQERIKDRIDNALEEPSGKKAEEDANVRMETKDAWETLGLSVAVATHVLPDEKNPKFCAVTEKTVKNSIQRINDNFTKKELSKPKQWIDGSAQAFHKVLSFKWKYKK